MALSTPAMLEGGRFTFPQQAYIAIAQNDRFQHWPEAI
jgi:hypothetical protein